MPDIDPAALSRTDSTTNLNPSSLSSKTLSISTPATQKSKPVPVAPRVDIEPLYTALKNVIGDYWSTYKDAISQFILGHLNQDELCRLTDHFISVDATREHLHNQLICGIHANVLRDPPEQPVASWVSANDKPTGTGLKPPSGDAAEQRLKDETMALPPRVRHRLKGINDDATPTPLLAQINAQNLAKSVHTSTLPTSSSSSATSALNKDADIRRRFQLPLISESRDLPPNSALTDRLTPICYEEGLLSGPAQPQGCAEVVAVATEIFIKESLAALFGRTRSDAPVSTPLTGPIGLIGSISGGSNAQNGSSYVMTASYKRRVEREERAVAAGELKRNEAGLLPAEVAAASSFRGRRGAPGDLKIALELGEPCLGGMAPWISERIVLGEGDAFWQDGGEQDGTDAAGGPVGDVVMTNGTAVPVVSSMVNGAAIANGVLHEEPMALDEEDWSWQGGVAQDREALGSLLDSCLAIGR